MKIANSAEATVSFLPPKLKGRELMQTQTEAAALTNREKGEKTSKLRKKIPAGKISVAIFIVVMLIYPLFRFGIMW